MIVAGVQIAALMTEQQIINGHQANTTHIEYDWWKYLDGLEKNDFKDCEQ